jgi:hypothetical protein
MHALSQQTTTTPPPGSGETLLDPEALARANINPRTRLATDYLNHFNEVVMLLELLPGAPEFADDILAWRPLSYHDYFVTSHFKDRELALIAYEAAEPCARQCLEELTETMNGMLLAALDKLRTASPDGAAALGTEVAAALKPVVARAGSVINAQQAVIEVADEDVAQAMADAVFEHFTP